MASTRAEIEVELPEELAEIRLNAQGAGTAAEIIEGLRHDADKADARNLLEEWRTLAADSDPDPEEREWLLAGLGTYGITDAHLT
jgi:tellurite resistance protein